MQSIFVVSYITESGDSGVVGYFDKEPSDGHLTAFFKEIMPDEFVKEGKKEYRYIHWDVFELIKEEMPKEVKPVESV
jgi:hypothetical protein